jgi:serine/threonine-protein kinase
LVRSIGAVEDKTIIQLGSPGSVRRGVRLNGMYEIETLIAQGGMGEVYKGFNIQTNDPVAIKMILPELASNADAFALFRREASTLHNLQHEAIVRYFVFSVDPDLQRAYLAMEFVDGPSLTKRLAQGRLTLAEVTILRKRIGGALEAAHRFGVIHRDISSDNVILPGNDPRRAKIIDFGIARSQRPGEGTLIGGGFAGKYNYVSPEQLGLAGGEVTAKSDIYSFGLVLAEALRGRPIDMNGTQVEIIEKRRSVPDLSDIDPSMRPLLQAMLQPLPADRPASMAAVAAWGESGTSDAARGPPERGGARPEGASAVGRLAAILGAVIVIASVGGTLYVFRDAMPWNTGASVPAGPAPGPAASVSPSPPAAPQPASEPASTHKLPPLPELPANPAAPDVAAPDKPPPATTTEVATPSPQPAPHVPSADEIVQSLNQLKQQKPDVAASNQTGAEPSPPPAKAPDVAPKKSEPVQTAAIAPPAPAPALPAAPPPRAPQTVLAIADAAVGKDYVADLPPFSASGGGKDLVLHAEPNPPEGLTFADLGSGFGQISGKPSKAGQYSFEIVARNQAGATAHMTTRIAVAPAPAQVAAPVVVAPAPAPAPKQAVAAIPPADKALSFMRDFDGGSCFLARPLGAASDSIAIQGIGSDKATFERFYVDFIKEIGVEPALTVRLIGAAECPAIDLIRAGGADRASAPKIDLAGYDVGRGKPLAGTVVNLAGRHLDLLLVSSDGQVYRLDARVQPDGETAAFSVPITPDAASIEALQLLLAIASPRPSPALEGFKAGAASDILPRLRSQLPDAAATLDVEFFKLVK